MPNSVQAAAKGMPNANRRTALALTATGIVAALGGMAATTNTAPASGVANSSMPAPSQILALFRKWEAHYHAACNVPDDVCNAQMTAANVIERQMMALPSSSAADMAAKFIVSTGYGEWIDDDEHLLNEARWLVGQVQP